MNSLLLQKCPVPMESRIELTALIKSVVEVFSLEGHSDIELFCDEKIFINADKDQMIRVFNNLIKNATQAIPQHQEGADINTNPADRK